MHVVVNTNQLIEENVITPQIAQDLHRRSRETMVNLAINVVLFLGILMATFGLIFWLADALSVAIVGTIFLALGLVILKRGGASLSIFANSSALIGSGMLMGGAGLELSDKYGVTGGWVMVLGGALVAVIALHAFIKGSLTTPFITGSIAAMGVALHLAGVLFLMDSFEIIGLLKALLYCYCAFAIAFTGWCLDVRLISAIALVPFAQALDTSTSYFHATYVFYSPESTLTILQMTLLIIAMRILSLNTQERHNRHFQIISLMGFIVANLCALVGSLWGDTVGQHLWGPGSWGYRENYLSFEQWESARNAFEANAWIISDTVYSIVWGVVLVLLILYFAHQNRRGMLNTAVTFLAIHAYTRLFENFYDKPLAFVIAGFSAIPLAWGMWRMNKWFIGKESKNPSPD